MALIRASIKEERLELGVVLHWGRAWGRGCGSVSLLCSPGKERGRAQHRAVLQGQPGVVVPTDSWAGASAELRVSVESSSFTRQRAREHGPGPEGPAPLQDHGDSREPLLLAPHWNPHLPARGPGYKVEGQEQLPPYKGKLTLVSASLSEELCQPAGHHSSLGTSWGGVQQRDEAGNGLQPRWVGPLERQSSELVTYHSTDQPSPWRASHNRGHPALFLRGIMAPGRRDAGRGQGAVATCATAQVALCKATAGHRQLVLQLGGSGDSPRLREERRRRSAEARELSMGKEGTAGLGSSHGEPLQPHWGRGGLSMPISQGCGGCC